VLLLVMLCHEIGAKRLEPGSNLSARDPLTTHVMVHKHGMPKYSHGT
jgi:hypothetical protein